MAIHNGRHRTTLDSGTTTHEQDTDILSNYHYEDIDNFQNVEHENHTTLKALTRDLDICNIEFRLLKVNLQKP